MSPKSSFLFNKAFFLTLLLLCKTFISYAQISISFPVNRIVFQRNNDNTGFVNIVGSYTEAIDKVEAKLTPIAKDQGTETDWILIQDQPKAGYFTGKIEGKGGWYKLDVRATKNGNIIKTISVEKVGIGEVFIALGQSNAQGIPNYGAKGSTDDRVNTINFQNSQVLDPLPENLNFVQLGEGVNIAPQGDGPWCYGELGDRLAKRLNVPIAFFNEGLLLVSVINWRESAEGQPTFNFVLDVGGRFQLPGGLPYVNLKNTLQYYGALMGVRSLLWIQGETDNLPNRLSADTYASNLQKVIDISRRDFDDKLTWMVSRTSITYQAPSNPEIIEGQNRIIKKTGNNVFAGPFTDNLQNPRPDNVHFQNIPGNMGISLLAENWDKAMDDNFFKNSTPVIAKAILEPEISCDSSNRVNLKLPEGMQSYEWSNKAKTKQITVDKGIFTAIVKDKNGNKRLVPTINTNWVYFAQKPSITADKNFEFCTDGITKIELTANLLDAKSFIWSSGETTQKISLSTSGEFSVRGKTALGCISETSDKIVIKANLTPAQPKIVVSPANNVCEGQNITITTDSKEKLIWSSSATSNSLTYSNIGNYEIAVRAISSAGCVSASSNLEKLSINPTPKQPTLSQIGLYTLKTLSTDLTPNDQFEWLKDNTAFSKTSLQNIKVTQTGNYQVSVNRTYQTPNNQAISCLSKPSNLVSYKSGTHIFSLYPNPAKDIMYIDTQELLQNVEVRFYTILGEEVFRYHADNTNEPIEMNIRNLEKGFYVVKIISYDFEDSANIIIQK
ncbi:hypothetical protein Emtol_1358 [Emticicia oligotrophica DSM 17448]|uniref:Secretion system C-terminal sorting domain-containing protein n=1 Tax=Emticicia oligotrophica (strain DSM 17448 / CIP 109782 / MTCC 6937 / GPTSA100-15) TaxID=929562 RepID=A0ABN4AK82_EMTOG|nr:T9SS type A sorting domain-containing protein [Emticicia oligotrophica]AFK02507.1 hypothetical protein Emtol_1358 [Emticicia oligotrophica DSM 17448]